MPEDRSDVPDTPPVRQVRAVFDDETVTVYQAYAPDIARRAVAAGRFVSPFKVDRMTWVKPSFLWMMYRCGWATKPQQERVLAVRIARDGFEEALRRSCLSHHDPDVHASLQDWAARKERSPVRVQWDPERSLHLEPLPWRSLQMGLSGPTVRDYVSRWTVAIADITPAVREIHGLVDAGRLADAEALLPREVPYPLPDDVERTVVASAATLGR